MALMNQKTAIEAIRLSEIHADYRWNARKATIRDDSDGVVGRPIIMVGTGGQDDPSSGRDGLVASIAKNGQDTPCIRIVTRKRVSLRERLQIQKERTIEKKALDEQCMAELYR